jgi:hypothetical protein
VLAPLLFLATWKHSFGTCGTQLIPEEYIAVQLEAILNGLSIRDAPSHSSQKTMAP